MVSVVRTQEVVDALVEDARRRRRGRRRAGASSRRARTRRSTSSTRSCRCCATRATARPRARRPRRPRARVRRASDRARRRARDARPARGVPRAHVAAPLAVARGAGDRRDGDGLADRHRHARVVGSCTCGCGRWRRDGSGRCLIPLLVAMHFAAPGTLGSLKESFFPSGGLIAQQQSSERGHASAAGGRPRPDARASRPASRSSAQGFGTRIVERAEANACILDNQWLGTLLETGAGGVIAWLWLFVAVVRRSGGQRRTTTRPRLVPGRRRRGVTALRGRDAHLRRVLVHPGDIHAVRRARVRSGAPAATRARAAALRRRRPSASRRRSGSFLNRCSRRRCADILRAAGLAAHSGRANPESIATAARSCAPARGPREQVRDPVAEVVRHLPCASRSRRAPSLAPSRRWW